MNQCLVGPKVPVSFPGKEGRKWSPDPKPCGWVLGHEGSTKPPGTGAVQPWGLSPASAPLRFCLVVTLPVQSLTQAPSAPAQHP